MIKFLFCLFSVLVLFFFSFLFEGPGLLPIDHLSECHGNLLYKTRSNVLSIEDQSRISKHMRVVGDFQSRLIVGSLVFLKRKLFCGYFHREKIRKKNYAYNPQNSKSYEGRENGCVVWN